jgi:hypothetical protein
MARLIGRLADADRRREMDDPLAIGDQRSDQRRILGPAMHENRLARRDMALDIGRQLRRGAMHLRVEAVEDDDLVSALGEQVDGMGADEAGPAGDKYFHVFPCGRSRLHRLTEIRIRL